MPTAAHHAIACADADGSAYPPPTAPATSTPPHRAWSTRWQGRFQESRPII